MADCARCMLNLAWCQCGPDPEVLGPQLEELRRALKSARGDSAQLRVRVEQLKAELHALEAGPVPKGSRLYRAEVERAFLERAREFLMPSGEGAEQAGEAPVDPCEGNPGDVPGVTGGDVSASPDHALDQRDDFANRYHQTLGAKWMCEAIVRRCRTELRLNRNAQAFADDIERRWAEESFWRLPARPG
jgi:hypothetical protein